jgi:hypothetical protein
MDKDDRTPFSFPAEREWVMSLLAGVKYGRVQNYFPTAKKLFEFAQDFPMLALSPIAPTAFKAMTTNNKFELYFGD